MKVVGAIISILIAKFFSYGDPINDDTWISIPEIPDEIKAINNV